MNKLQTKCKAIIDCFLANHPVVTTELNYQTPFQLLVATILSAQCTDKRINQVTPKLFNVFPTAQAMSKASFEEVYELIASVSYPNNKAKHLIAMAQGLMENFGGEVPQSVDELVTLSGVGRKTANVMCAVLGNQPTMPVDTHVFRVSERIGFTHGSKSPAQTEKELLKIIPTEFMARMHHWLVLHGRYVCKARKPNCEACFIKDWCDFYHQK